MIAPAAVALLALTLVPEARAESRLVPYAFYGSLQAADILSTRGAIARGGRETNPLAKEPLKVLLVVALAEGDRYLDQRGKLKAKWTARVLLGLAYGWMVAHNLRVNR